MKKFLLFFFVLVFQSINAQKYFTRTGITEFKASVAAFEPVEAKNNSTTVILVSNSGDVASQLFVSAFQFKVALMQEHFNENYMDSDKYPKAIFRGKLKDFSLNDIEEEKEFSLNGTLTVRGVKKKIETIAKIKMNGEKIYFTTSFSVKPKDFEIEIPSVVRKKIAESIQITLNYELVEKK